MYRGSRKLPRHMPPMKVPRRTAIDTADDPITSCRSWNQTTSYISAAQPLPTNSSRSAGRNRRGVIIVNRRPFSRGREEKPGWYHTESDTFSGPNLHVYAAPRTAVYARRPARDARLAAHAGVSGGAHPHGLAVRRR